ncbi:hypothetical protein SODG_003331 [Sodalis praecaptivus]|nr:hypothetical protein NVIRENTERO_04263 [Sodalis praecaptivus]
MLGVIITGHGAFASGLLQALEQVAGRQTLCMGWIFPRDTAPRRWGSGWRPPAPIVMTAMAWSF